MGRKSENAFGMKSSPERGSLRKIADVVCGEVHLFGIKFTTKDQCSFKDRILLKGGK